MSILWFAGGILAVIPLLVVQQRRMAALQRSQRALPAGGDSQLSARELIEAIPCPVFYKGRDGRYLGCNSAFVEYLGRPREEIIGRTVHELAPGELADRYAAADAALFAQTGSQVYEVKVQWSDGSLRDVVMHKATFAGADGPVRGLIGVITDITERKRAEDALSFVAQRGWVEGAENFFEALVKFLGKTLSVDHVIVSRLAEDTGVAVTVARYAKGSLVPNVRYGLKGTPCENVMGQRFCFYPQGIQQTFPEDALLVEMGARSYAGLPLWDSTGQPIGLIAVMDGKPLRDEAQVSQVLQFMATRAAAELERERNDRNLRRSEREFRGLAENMPDRVIRYDLQARVQYMNPALMANVAPEFLPVLGEAVTQTYPGNEGAAGCERRVEQVIATGVPAELEFQMPNPQGEMRLNQVRLVAERDDRGEIIGALGIGRDITEQRASERQLRQALEFTQGVINAIPDLLFEVDRDGTYLNVWAQNPDLLAVQKEALLGKTVSDVMTPDAAEAALSAIREADDKGMSFGKVYRIELPRGESWFELSVSKKPGSDVPCRFIVLSRDITGRKQMEDDIRRREIEFRTLAESMPDNVIRYDRQARVLYMNPAFMANVAPEVLPVVGESLVETYPDRDAAAGHQRIVEQVIATGTPTEVEFQLPNPRGEMRIHQARCVAERDGNGEIVGALGIGRDITENKRMEDDIRRRELEFRALAENIPDNVVRYDRQARVLYMNPAIMANVAPDFRPVLGESPIETYPGREGAAGHQRIVERVIATGIPAEWEFQTRNPQGEMRIHHARYVAERDGNGEIVGVLGIGRDITERKRAERYEQFRSQTLELLAGGASLQVVLEGIVRGVEQLTPGTMCSILLLDDKGKRLGEGIAPSLPDFYNAAVEGIEIGVGIGCCGTAAATGERVIVEDIQTHPYWAPYKELTAKAGLGACWSEPIRSSTGVVLGTFATYHREAHWPADLDISIIEKSVHLVSIAIERRRAEEALHAREQEFRTLAENLPDFLVRYDREGRRTYVNPALEQVFGVKAEQMIGRTLPETNPTGMVMIETYQRALEHTLATGERSEFEMQIPLPDGNLRTGLCFMVAERAADGRISGAIALSRDITERKRNEAELERHRHHLEKLVEERTLALSIAKETAESATRAKTRFLAAASHDLRQPLQAIGLLQEALARTCLNEKQEKISLNLSRSVNSLGEMLNQLLDVSKLDAGMLEPQPEMISLDDLLGTIAAEFDSVVCEKNLRLNLFCPRGGPALFSDRNLLLNILRNLVGNAVKYTSRGGVLVGIRRRDNRALIQIWDTGIGIAPGQVDLIFEEYFQAGNPERGRAKGVGLGLAIVRRLSELLGTQVRCRSRVGKGSVFELSLPLADESGKHATSATTGARGPARASGRLAGKRIVVIEDDAMAGEAIKLSLEIHGMQVIHFVTGEDALESSEAMEADYYISDYRLPGMDGLELLDAIQENAPKPIKAVVLTGDTSPDQIRIMRSSGWKVLHKPVDLSRLLSVIEAHQAEY